MDQHNLDTLKRRKEYPIVPPKPMPPVPMRPSHSNGNATYQAPSYQAPVLPSRSSESRDSYSTHSRNSNGSGSYKVPSLPPRSPERRDNSYNTHSRNNSGANNKIANHQFNLDSSYTTNQQNTMIRHSINFIAPPNFSQQQGSSIQQEINNHPRQSYKFPDPADYLTSKISPDTGEFSHSDGNEDYVDSIPALTWANHDSFNRDKIENQDYFNHNENLPAIIYDHEPNNPLSPGAQRRNSLSCLTTLGLDSNLVSQEQILHPGLLSEIVESFKRTSQEIMTGSQILDLIEKAANLPRGNRSYSILICQALEPYNIFTHTVDEDLPLLDGYEEIYVVDIGRLQKPTFSPKSVLTYLTKCYYPTCSIIEPCNQYGCPTRKLYLTGDVGVYKVVNRLCGNKSDSIQSIAHRKSKSHVDISSIADTDTLVPSIFTIDSSLHIAEEAELWIQAVPKEIVESVNVDEKKRQELIFETIKTERDFVKDMELIDVIFVRALKKGNVYEKSRVEAVLSTLFYNYKDITLINQILFQKLKKRQMEDYIVYQIGDIFLEWAKNLECYAHYGGHLAYTQDFIKNEIEYNPKFAQFLKECEKHPESRRLSIQSFVGRATTRLGRYPLLLESILKKSSENSPDKILIPQALDLIRDTLNLVNKLAGEADEKLKINYINSHLYFKPEDEYIEPNLDQPGRKLIKEGPMKRVSPAGNQNIKLFLFDNVLILAKEKKKVVTEYRAICPAIPLHAMHINEDANVKSYYQKLAETTKTARPSTENTLVALPPDNDFVFSITYFGKKPGVQYITAANAKEKSTWVQLIQDAIQASPYVVNKIVQTCNVFQSAMNQAHIICTCDYKTKIDQVFVFGCDDGVHILSQAGALRRVIRSTHKVIQIEIVEEYHVVLVLTTDKLLMAYHLEVLNDSSGKISTLSTKLSENVAYFRIGQNGNQKLLISVKHNSLKSYFKTMEFVNMNNETKLSQKNKLLWHSKYKTGLRFLKKFYVATIANNVSFLKTRLAIACGPGFEIVSLDALDRNYSVPELTDPIIASDSNLFSRFVNATPLSMLRANPGEFLLCYKGFGLYISNNGKTSRGKQSVVEWLASPTNFKLIYPNLICFDTNLIEIRRIDTGELLQVILCNNLILSNPTDLNQVETQCITDTKNQSGQRLFRILAQPQTIPPSPAGVMDSYDSK
ncbi:hypothetical protein K502DRAFT_320968 [Neoconidiobolus thromboides FSU 785]|nr:hypothetical protein K502DRAFT_320968 [Neoconidiobolus thromboides FSU 785]